MIQNINTTMIKVVMTTNTELKKLIKLFFIIDFGVIIFTLLESNFIWFINTQFAFFSSLFITFASYLSYKNFIDKNVQNLTIDTNYQERDTIDKIEDPYDLYDEDQDQQEIEQKEISKEEFAKVIQEEKQNLKKDTLKNTFRGLRAYSSIYRIIGYTSLVVGFLYLNNHQLFHTISYLFGLFIVPFSATIYKFIK